MKAERRMPGKYRPEHVSTGFSFPVLPGHDGTSLARTVPDNAGRRQYRFGRSKQLEREVDESATEKCVRRCRPSRRGGTKAVSLVLLQGIILGIEVMRDVSGEGPWTSDELENTVAQSLMAIGLYTIHFEVTALSFRGAVYEYLKEVDPALVPQLVKSCKTAYATFSFCGPILVSNGAIEQTELDALEAIRERRNLFAHEGYNHVFDLEVRDVLPDVQQLHKITKKVEAWRGKNRPESRPPHTIRAQVSPAFFSYITRVVEQMCWGRINLQKKQKSP
jgi:hypothetical protein